MHYNLYKKILSHGMLGSQYFAFKILESTFFIDNIVNGENHVSQHYLQFICVAIINTIDLFIISQVINGELSLH